MDRHERVGTSTAFDKLGPTPDSQQFHGVRAEQVPLTFKPSEHTDLRTTNRYAELLQISKVVASHRNLKELFQDLASRLHSMVDFHFLSVVLHDPLRDLMRMHVLEADGLGELHPGMEFPMDESPSGWVWKTQRPLFVPDIEREGRFERATRIFRGYGVRSFCSFPLTTPPAPLGSVHSRQRPAECVQGFRFGISAAGG